MGQLDGDMITFTVFAHKVIIEDYFEQSKESLSTFIITHVIKHGFYNM